MFNIELSGLYKREQYEDFVRESTRSSQRSARRMSVAVLLLTTVCIGLALLVFLNSAVFHVLTHH